LPETADGCGTKITKFTKNSGVFLRCFVSFVIFVPSLPPEGGSYRISIGTCGRFLFQTL